MSATEPRTVRNIEAQIGRDQQGYPVVGDHSDPGDLEIRTVGIGDRAVAGHENLFRAYGRFRAWIYTTSGILDPGVLNDDGTDFDRYDPYSIHLAALQTTVVDGERRRRVVGSTRMIFDLGDVNHRYAVAGLRANLGRLPIETYFPELATDVDLRENRIRCEVSRYAAQHRRSAPQRRITLLLRAGIGAVFTNADAEIGYAVVEERLADVLRRDGVGVEPLTIPRFLDHYQSVNFGAQLDLDGVARQMDTVTAGVAPQDVRIGNDHAVSRRSQTGPKLRILER